MQLGAPTYGLAEQAANIIRAYYNGVGTLASSSSTSDSNPSNSKPKDNAAVRPGVSWISTYFFALAGVWFVL
jgi:choline dehydrogenase